MKIEKLKKVYKPNIVKFRRKWVNLFRNYSKKNKLQPSAVIVFVTFVITIVLTLLGFTKYAFLPFATGCSFILVTFIYFHFFPLTWKEMNDEEKEAYRFYNQLPNDWDLEK
jgi:fatty acid desaturase